VHVMALLVKLSFFILTIQVGVELAVAYDKQDALMIMQQILFMIIVPTIYQGLLELCESLRNPFGTDSVDFPRDCYHKGMAADVNAFLTNVGGPP